MDPTYPLIPIANFIGLFLTLVSLVGLINRPWNTGVFMLAVYISLKSLTIGVNTIVWSDNANDLAPIWCDISSHLSIFCEASIPACLFVVSRRLFNIVRLRSSVERECLHEKRKEILLEFITCLGFPVIVIGLYYTVQGARYNIYEELGCLPAPYICGSADLLFIVGNYFLPLVSLFVYTPRILWALYRQQREVAQFLGNTDKKYRPDSIRSLVLIFIVVPSLTASLALNLSVYTISAVGDDKYLGPFYDFWPGWINIHADWEPNLITANDWKLAAFVNLFLLKYPECINPVYCGCFFAIYGLSENVRQQYRSIFLAIVKPFGIRPKPSESGKTLSTIVFHPTPVLGSYVSSTEVTTVENQ